MAELIKETTNIELMYNNIEDINNLASKSEFVSFILDKTLNSILKAIKEKQSKIKIFNIVNLALTIEIDKTQYAPILQRIIDYYGELENYEKCAEIQKEIKKLK